MMKFLFTAAAIVLLAGMAQAEERKPAAPRPNPYSIEQINRVLEARGERPLYSSRVLHDDGQRTRKSESTLTITTKE